MAHTFLSIDLSLIKANTRSNQNSFGLLSNDGLRRLIDGYNSEGELVTDIAFKNWVKLPSHSNAAAAQILSTAIVYTQAELEAEKLDVNSIYYEGGVI